MIPMIPCCLLPLLLLRVSSEVQFLCVLLKERSYLTPTIPFLNTVVQFSRGSKYPKCEQHNCPAHLSSLFVSPIVRAIRDHIPLSIYISMLPSGGAVKTSRGIQARSHCSQLSATSQTQQPRLPPPENTAVPRSVLQIAPSGNLARTPCLECCGTPLYALDTFRPFHQTGFHKRCWWLPGCGASCLWSP